MCNRKAEAQTYEVQKDVARAEQAYRAVIATRHGAGAPTLGAAKTLVDLALVAMSQRLCRRRKDAACGGRRFTTPALGLCSCHSGGWLFDSTADLIANVYRHLKAGVTKDEALQRAQREAIRQPNTSAPFHWAAFTLSGDWR